jgi:hypothetical protein
VFHVVLSVFLSALACAAKGDLAAHKPPLALQELNGSADRSKMGPSSPPENFYLYLWRSPNSPGTLYLAKGFETAEALCRGLTEDGYIVKVIHMTTDTEFELCDGKLRPTGTQDQGSSGQGMSPAFA